MDDEFVAERVDRTTCEGGRIRGHVPGDEDAARISATNGEAVTGPNRHR